MSVVMRWLDIAAFFVFAVFAFATGIRDAWWFAGLALVIVDLPMWLWARVHLSASFSVSAQARKLVTTGPYAKVRHPVYVFGGAAWTGAVVGLLGWRGLVVGAGIVAVEVLRAWREEAVLAEAFGEQWDAYRRTTWF